MTRQERRNQLARDRGFASAYAERVARGQAKGLSAAQAVGKAPRPLQGATSATAAVGRTETAAGTVYRINLADPTAAGRTATLFANLGPMRRVTIVAEGSDGRYRTLTSRRLMTGVRSDVRLAGGIKGWIEEVASDQAGAGSDWLGAGVSTVSITVTVAK